VVSSLPFDFFIRWLTRFFGKISYRHCSNVCV